MTPSTSPTPLMSKRTRSSTADVAANPRAARSRANPSGAFEAGGASAEEPLHRSVTEVLQVLRQGMQVEIGVLVCPVVLVVPVVGEHPAVHVADEGRSTVPRLDDVLQLVEPAVLALDPGDEVVRRFPDGHRTAERRLATRPGLVLHGPQPAAGSGGDGVPDLLRCCRQLGFADDFEFSGHGQSSVVRLVLGSGVFSAPGGWVMLGCRAVMRRCRRPPPALSSWYLAIRPSSAAPSSAAKAARSAAEANLISLSIAKVANSFRAAPAPASSSPTSCTMRAARPTSHRADSWSGERSGSGATAANAVGEMT